MSYAKIVIFGEAGSGRTTLGLRILELLKNDGWDIRSTTNTFGNDDIEERLQRRTPESIQEQRDFVRPKLNITIQEEHIRKLERRDYPA